MPKGIPHIRHLYATLRGMDADCLDLSAVIDLLGDIDRRLSKMEAYGRSSAAQLTGDDPSSSKPRSKSVRRTTSL